MPKVSTAILVTTFVLALEGYAQTITGSISGRILDQQGAAVMNATVTATEPDKNITSTMKTGDQGEFGFTALEPGNYNLSVAAP
jgi:trimeric autotransporter adhesin